MTKFFCNGFWSSKKNKKWLLRINFYESRNTGGKRKNEMNVDDLDAPDEWSDKVTHHFGYNQGVFGCLGVRIKSIISFLGIQKKLAFKKTFYQVFQKPDKHNQILLK